MDFFPLKWQKSKEIVQHFSAMMALTSACFPYPYQYWLHARAEAVSVSVTHSIWINRDAPCEGPGTTARQSPNRVGRGALQLSHRLPQSSVSSDSCKEPFPCPECPSWLSGEHLGQVTRSGPGSAGSLPGCSPSSLPASPPCRRSEGQ